MSRRRKARKRNIFFIFFILIFLGLGFGFLYLYYSKDISIIFPYRGEIPSYVLNSTIPDFEKELDSSGLMFSSISLMDDESGIIVEVDRGITVIFSQSKSATYQVSALQSILKSLTINSVQGVAGGQAKSFKMPKRIDFRYSKPIVNF